MDERDVTVPSGTFHYLHAGRPEAPLVLLLHGFPDCPLTFAELLSRLADAGYRVVAPWLRGYRPSTAEGPFVVERLAVDALEIAQALSPDRPVHLVGHDWGAVIAHVAAIQTPDRIASLTSVAFPHPVAFLRAMTTRSAQLARSWYILMFQLPGLADRLCARRDGAFIDYLWRTWSPGYRLPADLRESLHRCLLASMPAPLQYYRGIVRPPAIAARRIRRLSRDRVLVPTLHLHGADDGCVESASTDAQERFFAGPFNREIWSGIGHFMHLEAPERLAARIIRFCAEHDRPTSGDH